MFSKHAKPAVASNLRILEPACGSGRLLEELSARGHGVTGFDVEPAMVEFSRQRLKSAGYGGSVIKQRMEKFTIPGKFDMAYCLVSTFKYLLNERDARSHLRDIAGKQGSFQAVNHRWRSLYDPVAQNPFRRCDGALHFVGQPI